eukprot:11710272-Ditylum_brightwellii.AAC.1
MAIDKSTMNRDSEQYIQDLIHTSVFEIVKTNEDIEQLLANGLLKSIKDIPEINACATIILHHNCDDRCKMRIGPGDSPENCCCRKMNSVWNSPDTTCYNYIPFKYKYEQSTLDVLEEIGMHDPPEDNTDMNSRGPFSHAFFDPLRHIPPCNINADCNMSPVPYLPHLSAPTNRTRSM